ncbi:MAG: hypothetical protein AB4911_16310 [Oscillochloridaceae bacterium umkhey_bin13]
MAPHITLFGVPVTLRPTALGAGLTSALVVALLRREQRIAWGFAAGMLWYTADAIHVSGHILSSRLVGAPMDAVDFGWYPMSVYADHDVTPQQHLGRASGSVSASLLAAIILFLLARCSTPPAIRYLLTIAAMQHGFLFGASMLPLPQVDGGVISTNLRHIMQTSS